MRFLSIIALIPAALAAPVIVQPRADQEAIAGKWIVTLREDADDSLLSSALASVASIAGAKSTHEYNFGGFKGFAMEASDSLLGSLQNIASIATIEPDSKVFTNALVTQQNVPSYGLARISHKTAGQTTYVYDESAGQDTYAYIIDTGIFTDHTDFGGRAVFGASFAEGETPTGDGNGHGTHVAGTTGSTTYGVAKKTNLIAVKVLSAEGSGSLSQVIAGIQWAVNDMKSKNRVGKAVANLSLGGLSLVSQGTNQAAAAATREGLFLAVAAGNSALPTITSSPASAPEVCTVGAIDNQDNLAYYSNFGGLVDVVAPGSNITSTWIRSTTDTNTISGTSMATPHVAGLGAYLLALEGPRTPDALCKRIQELSNKNQVKGAAMLVTKNFLAYNGAA